MKLLLPLLLYSIQVTAITLVPTPPSVTADAYILQDFHSGRVLMEKNINKRIEPASLTKLMTAYLVFKKLKAGKIKLDDTVTISEKAWRMTGSRMYLEVNTQVSVELLLKGMIIQSGNDASVALAEFIGGTEEAFASLMNEQAKQLGLNGTHYVNSTGMPDEQHYTTVQDLVTLSQLLIRNFPEYYLWYSEQKLTYNNITQPNRNRLLKRDPSVDGMKTGYTEKAGYCLVSSAKREKMRLISVVMGTKSDKKRIRESEIILDYGFRFFETFRIYEANQPLDFAKVWKGDKKQFQLGLADILYVTIPKGQYNKLRATVFSNPYIIAPVKKGEDYGTLKITMGNQVVLEHPLIALNSVNKGALWERLIDSFFLFFY
ncbi:D-alanyl-D-alanine carboxypeptidase family protein [Candidatus Halobeggiatoa sp. HSG11]|nr:D-alanyl-D-alanine carboxypeptidase family protein [Candidatus Halobeggiatoa sp. HSG11]